jgi:hypothetical protein
MAKLGDLVVRIGADTRDLNKSLGRVERNMKSMMGNMEKLGRSITTSVTLPLAGMAALSVQAFRDQAKAVAQVEQGLKSTGNAAGRTLGELTKMASDLQKNTLFGDEDILQNATAQLLTFTNIAGKEFDRTQKAALDLATRLGGDLKSASIQLGKALNDPIANLSALSRSGIQFSKEQKEVIKSLAETGQLAKAQGIILDELEKQYGGSAEAAAEADGGITQLKNALGDLGEELGKIITQNLQPFIKRVMSIVEGFQGLDGGVKRAIVALGSLAAAFGPILFFLPQIITQLGLLATAIAANPILAAAGVITAIGVALQAMTSDAKQARTSIEELRDSFKELDEESRKQKRAEKAATIELLTAYIDLQQQIADAQETATEGFKKGSFPAINAGIRGTREFTATLTDNQKEILKQGDALLGVKRNTAVYTTQVDNAVDMVIDLQNQMAALTPVVVNNTEAVEEQAQAFRYLGGGLEEASHAITDWSHGVLKARPTIHDLLRDLTNVETVISATTEKFIDMGAVISQALLGIGQAFDGTGNFIMKGLQVLGNLMTSIGNQMVTLAVSMQKFRKFIITNPGLAIAAGLGFVIAGQALSNMAQRNLEGMPALAEGGIAFGPTTALIGDNKNARIDPEVVAPLSKLRDMMGGNQVEVFGRISGNDIFLSNSRTGTSRNRYA